MRLLIIGWIILLFVSISMHFLFFEQLENDYDTLRQIYETDKNTQVVRFLQKNHYMPSSNITDYIADSSNRQVTPQQACESSRTIEKNLLNTQNFSQFGTIFRKKLEQNNQAILTVCDNSSNLINQDNFFKSVSNYYFTQQSELHLMRSCSVKKQKYSNKTDKTIRYWFENTVFSILFFGAFLMYMKWKES